MLYFSPPATVDEVDPSEVDLSEVDPSEVDPSELTSLGTLVSLESPRELSTTASASVVGLAPCASVVRLVVTNPSEGVTESEGVAEGPDEAVGER